jgi:putative ABC transport system permease protein
MKACMLGLIGGLGGIALGLVVALGLGPRMLDVDVVIRAGTPMLGLATAVAVSLAASYLPARRAARLDPCVCFREN